MAGNGTLRDPMKGLRDFCCAEIWSMEMSKVNEPPRRFEAGFFASEGYRAVDAMHRSGFDMETVGKAASVVWPGVFARRFVKDPQHGAPFMATSVMMEARPRPSNYLSFKNTKNLDAYLVREDTILISRSGTVGNVCLTTKDIEGWAVSDDAIRVTVNHPDHLGPVYCFLQSPLGQFLLKKSQTGSVVRHIYEVDVSTLPIPRLPRALRDELTRLVKQASALRVEANRLLDEAEEMVQKQLYLPDIEEFDSSQRTDGVSFSVSHAEKFGSRGVYGTARLDATYHRPEIETLRKCLSSKRQAAELHTYVSGIFRSSLRQRVFVDEPTLGIPMMGGKELMRLRLTEPKYLSKLHTKKAASEQVGAGWTLVTSGGTLGRTMFVHRNLERWAVSEHVLKVVPDPMKVAPGFVFAFLSSSYGKLQIDREAYGSVIPMLRDFQLGRVMLALPDDRGESIHEVVVQAFSARADAIEAEDQAFALFMAAVKQGRKTIESEWGDQY
mgnify:CR=1 FL=1